MNNLSVEMLLTFLNVIPNGKMTVDVLRIILHGADAKVPLTLESFKNLVSPNYLAKLALETGINFTPAQIEYARNLKDDGDVGALVKFFARDGRLYYFIENSERYEILPDGKIKDSWGMVYDPAAASIKLIRPRY